jgi:sphingolipid delta-4 desaturase
MGDLELDAGVPGPTEARVVGRSGSAKALWVALTFLVQGVLRPRRLTRVRLLDGWTVVNIVVQIACMVLLFEWAGWPPLKYLIVSSIFAIGLHPPGPLIQGISRSRLTGDMLNAGPLNKVSFNVGLSQRGCDIVTIPVASPDVRRIAPEFYEGLHSYSSWTGLLVRFLHDHDITLFNYVVRPHVDLSGGPRPSIMRGARPAR